MIVQEAFAEAVSNPRDDAPRERFAAALWVEGQESSADFVRCQLDRCRLRRRDLRWVAATEAAAAADGPPRHLDERFAAPIRGWRSAARVGWGRGLPERVTVNAIDVATDGETLRQRMPLCELTIRDYAAVGPTFFDLPVLAGLRSLAFVPSPFSLADVEALAASPMLTRLLSLGLANLDLPPEALDILARSPVLSRLRYARLDGNQFADPNAGDPLEAAWLRTRHGARAWFDGFVLGTAPPSEAFDPPVAG